MSAKIKARRDKETRWDLIRKKHINCINVTTETVRKFLTIDLVDEKKILRGSGKKRLDPVLVMDMRHEMIKRRPKEDDLLTPKRTSSAGELKSHSQDDDKAKKSSELSMIEKELEKFKSDIQRKLTPRKNIQKVSSKKKKKSILIKLNNSGIFQSFSEAGGKSKDFFETAKNAIESSRSEETDKSESTARKDDEEVPKTSVRFGDDIQVITYSREPSTMTPLEDEYEEVYEDEIDSLIEDEADFFGLREEEEPKLFNYSQKTVTTTTYQQFTYSSKSKNAFFTASPNPSSSTLSEDAESTESSELNFYQMFNIDEEKEQKNEEETLQDSLTIKSFNSAPEFPEIEDQDLVQEIIRVKTIANVENRHKILRKFLLKWLHFTTIQKITKDSNLTTKSQRMTKIDAYLKKIREQKKIAKQQEKNVEEGKVKVSKDNSIVLMKRYQSKLKLQQDIIEVQKLKLERQEKMIAELRLSRLSEDAKKFKQDLREELRNAMRTGDVRLRAKAKCLQVVGDVVEEQEEKFVAYGNMIPKFLAKMQERALERQLRHEQAKERRVLLDQERDAQKQAFEDEKRKADEEAKRQRMLELLEKRKREKQEKIRKEQDRERYLENIKKANAFYRNLLLRRFGFDPLKKLIKRKRTLELQVTNMRKKLKMKSCFKVWASHTRLVWTLKFDKAQDFYEMYLQRISLRVWKENLLMARGQMLVAVDWHEMKMNEKFFSVWLAFTREAKLAEETKLKHAEAHHKWHIMWKMLEHWQRLHSVLKLEKETEERRQRWRHKIWELLPDYTPSVDN